MMRLSVSRSKNSTSLYVIKSTYEEGRHSSKIVEKLGTVEKIASEHPGLDPYEWARTRLAELNEAKGSGLQEVVVRYPLAKVVPKDEQRLYRGGYLFLQKVCYELGIDGICKKIASQHKFTYDLAEVLLCLVYGRVLDPCSKLQTHQFSKTLIEPATFSLQHTYRALGAIAADMDFIQSELYKNSKKASKRNDAVLYYDCTNYFFETECEDGIRRYGYSKEHRPNPIVQMGLFMDGDGVPLAFCINPGNTNEQTTLKPLEKKILSEFGHAKFIVCTDAGLSSAANRRFNDTAERSFITTQSIKQLKGHLKKWALDPTGFKVTEGGPLYDLTAIDKDVHKDTVFYKERWVKDDGLEQRLVITYSPKYKDYQRTVRGRQIERAIRLIATSPKKIGTARQNDFKRLIHTSSVTGDGEVAKSSVHTLDEARIADEEAYDGFYGVCTNLEGDAAHIAAINRQRWQIEECFRIMKHEMKARPVHLSREDRIKAHFMTCFVALIVYRVIEKRLGNQYTCDEIIDGLRSMDLLKAKGEGWIPVYTRTDFTDSLHEAFGFRTDFQIVTNSQMKKIIKSTRKKGHITQ